MPVYSLIAVTRTATAAAASKRICKDIITGGGVVCAIENWGNQPVAQPMYVFTRERLSFCTLFVPSDYHAVQPKAQELAHAGPLVPLDLRCIARRCSKDIQFAARR
jgi:hypothetical protein